jgi:hypothetical protein
MAASMIQTKISTDFYVLVTECHHFDPVDPNCNWKEEEVSLIHLNRVHFSYNFTHKSKSRQVD